MFDTSSFRIRYKARMEKPALVFLGPALLAFVAVLAAFSRFVSPLSLGSWLSADLLGLLLPVSLLALLAVGVELLLGGDEGYPWRRSAAATGAGVVGGTLLVGAWSKLLDPKSFEQSLVQEGLVVLVPAVVIALVAIGLEVLLGSALVLGVRRLWVLVASTALVTFFLLLTGRSYLRFMRGIEPDDSSCGCFGNLLDRTPAEAFWQDFALLVPGLVLAGLSVVVRTPTARRTLLAVALTVAAVTLAWFAPGLPIDDLATRLSAGTAVEGICSGQGEQRLCLPTLLPELREGRHLVVLADLEDEVFGAEVERLNAHWLAGNDPPVWVVSAATPEQSQAFFWQHGPSFEIREAPPSLLAPLYRTLPRSFEVLNGRVVKTWTGLPPLGGDAAEGGGSS
jgi:hypothetical protein